MKIKSIPRLEYVTLSGFLYSEKFEGQNCGNGSLEFLKVCIPGILKIPK